VETTLGTAIAPTAFIPVRSFKPQDNYQYISDKGNRGTLVNTYGEYQGTLSGEYSIDGDAYPTSFGNLLAAFFGSDTVTGTATPYSHKFALSPTSPTAPSYTLADYYVAGFRNWPGARMDKLTIKFTPDAGLTYTAHFMGFPSATGTAPVSTTFATNPYFLGWEANLSVNGTQNARLNSFTLTLTRQNAKVLFSAANSQKPWDIFLGPGDAEWDLDFYMQDDTEYSLGVTAGTVPVTVTLTQPGTNYAITLTSSAVQFTKPTIDRSKDYVAVSLTGTGLYNATDNGAVTATLVNGVSTSYVTTASS
jgi:hypothetical protein